MAMESLYDIDLIDWVPDLLLSETNDRGGQVIEATYWNAQWNLHRLQGDFNARTIYEILVKLNDTIWHPIDGLAKINHPDPTAGELASAEDTASYHLSWTMLEVERLLPLLSENGTNYMTNEAFEELVRPQDPELAGMTLSEILAYLKLLSNMTNQRIDDISTGELSAFNHNDVGQRDVFEAHPGAAISVPNRTADGVIDITTEIVQLREDNATIDAVLQGHIAHDTVVKHDAIELSTLYGGTTTSLQGALNTIYNTFLNITGDVESLVFKHADITERDAANAHPATAISSTGSLGITVQAALTQAAIDIGTKQNKILSGTAAPSAALGVDGDVYIQYA